MASLQKQFLKRVSEVWGNEFPFLKPVHLREIPQLPKGCNFLCADYFTERKRAYFIRFDFCLRRIGEFSLAVTVSDSATRSILEPSLTPPSPLTIGTSGIGSYIGQQTRRWALVDVNAKLDELLRSLGGHDVAKFSETRSPYTWYPPSFDLPQIQIFDAAISDVGSVLTKHVFPKLHIQYETLAV